MNEANAPAAQELIRLGPLEIRYLQKAGNGSYLQFVAPGVIAMGILFGWLYDRYGRLLPLVIAHVMIDAVIFIGYPWAYASFPALFA